MTFVAYLHKNTGLDIVYVGSDSYRAWMTMHAAWEESPKGYAYVEVWRNGHRRDIIEYYGQEEAPS